MPKRILEQEITSFSFLIHMEVFAGWDGLGCVGLGFLGVEITFKALKSYPLNQNPQSYRA